MATNFEIEVNKLSDLLVETERGRYKSTLQPFENYAAQLRKKFIEDMQKFYEKFSKGYQTLLEELQIRKERNQLEIPLTAFKLTEKKMERVDSDEALLTHLREGENFQQMLGITNRTMLEAYSVVEQMFEQRRYQDCVNSLIYLTTLNPMVPDFWIALGAAYQADLQYEGALMAYKLALMLNPESLDPYIRIGQCCIASRQPDEAIQIFTQMIDIANEFKEMQKMRKIKKELKAMIKYLKKLK